MIFGEFEQPQALNMLKPKVYIETSIPSFYHEVRTEPDMAARRGWTQEWWDERRKDYELVTSDAVLDELSRGNHPVKEEALRMVQSLELVEIVVEIEEIVEAYIRHKVMPNDPVGDAMHLALASFHKCDFLLTWNCRHLANANKFGHIRRVNTLLGLYVPILVTPLELLGGMDNEG
jgi:predicted nucleic acid-binding protein